MPTVLAGIQLLPNQKEDYTDGIIKNSLEVIEESGLRYVVGPLETVVEGDFDSVMNLLNDIQKKAVKSGAKELVTNVKIHYRSQGVTFEDKK
ncbi:thiamine-binding protein [Alkalihalobacillus pseudalcaliphilus]|uniref:thiamine-binding protein n=1 Tax=Alkalihalobacillus pseudalcaliphilus TaxID=79884 RepID=UPI00064DEEC6|nr:thiamine-binding protein [Alkalihalobacillus pseudalcaliphilus]KMK76807.1 hypothetical protein AB990_07830 [Alkalihalobacillus pseudalcaliphilus]